MLLRLVAAFALVACSSADETTIVETSTAGAGGGGGSSPTLTTRIAFGSCMHQSKPKPVLELATASAPDHFVFLGDNIYGDTDDMVVLQQKYAELAAAPEFQGLLAAVPVVATWDDHDYGRNDAGKEYPFKAESKQIFLDFWQEPAGTVRRSQEGIYTSYFFEEAAGTVQVIVLDTRWFRDALDLNTGQGKNDYVPTMDTTKTMLGEAQWTWLDGELRKPADVRIVASSIQFGHEYNGWESWTNMPHERQRLIDLIRDTGASTTIFISGDVHWGELSKQDVAGGYPLYDLTSSGITEDWPVIETNANRIGDPVAEHNYGFVEIAWGAEPLITLGLVDVNGTERIRHSVSASDLAF